MNSTHTCDINEGISTNAIMWAVFAVSSTFYVSAAVNVCWRYLIEGHSNLSEDFAN